MPNIGYGGHCRVGVVLSHNRLYFNMYKLPATHNEDLAYFGTLIDDFRNGNTEPVKFKGTRVPMGIYEQRKDGTYMMRVRCTGGYISPAQLTQLALTAQNYRSEMLHLTTRQEIQIHHISIDQVKDILPELQVVGLSSKGGGGNTVRNILADINSGISASEVFDVLPYAADLTSRLIAEPDSFTLPRKLKIAFSTSEANTDFAVVNDLGFIAKIKDGKRGFKVFLGGSVASNPTLGWEIFDFAPEEELFNIAIAAKRFFSNHGNRKNKHKARIRYIFYKEGEERARELFFNYYLEIKSHENNVYSGSSIHFKYKLPHFEAIKDDTADFRVWKNRYVSAQKQSGLFATIIPFNNGNTNGATLLKIAEFAEAFGDDVLRFTARQQLQIRNIPEAFLGNLYQLVKQLNLNIALPLLINNVVSCTGADTCRLGICLSKGASSALRERLANSTLDLDSVNNLQINISGCPNSCAQQIWSDIGFSGRVGRNERMYAAYNVFVGASKQENPQLGQVVGTVSARDLPEFTEAVISDYLKVKNEYPLFRNYLNVVGKDNISVLIAKYQNVPDFSRDKNYYYDWGSEELFSVANRGPAECSAGLFDMIEVDLDIINKSIKQLEGNNNPAAINQTLYNILFSSSRMLLVTKGAEPRTTAETFEFFIDKFINEGLVDSKYRELVKIAGTSPDYNFYRRKAEVISLSETVIKLYESMDDSLQFKIQPIENKEAKTEHSEAKTHKPLEVIRVKDFRGVPCPLNFVKTKIELSTLNSGDLLEIWLDDGQPIQNVPGSVRNEGHRVKYAIQEDYFWKVLIEKAS